MGGPRSYKPQTGVRFPQLRPTRFIPRSTVVSRPLKPVTLVRLQLGEPYGGRGVLECTPRCERGGAGSIPAGHPDCIYIESADEWSSTGPENRGGGDEPQRFDSSALVREGPFGYQLGCRPFKAAKRGQH